MYFALFFLSVRLRAALRGSVRLRFSILRIFIAWISVWCLQFSTALHAQNAIMMEAFIPATLSARIGDTALVPVLVGRLNPAAQNLRIDSCQFILRFNPTILAPLPSRAIGEISLANNRAEITVTFRLNRRLRENDILGQIPMLACLGDMETTELAIGGGAANLPAFRVFANGADSAFTIPTTNGLLRIENARWNGALRSINANIGQLSMIISPNPIGQTMTFELSVGGLPPPPALGSASLALYGANGREIPVPAFVSLSDRFLGQPFMRASFQRPPALRGTFFARFAYGAFSITRMVVLE
jgi:hypothetical protein